MYSQLRYAAIYYNFQNYPILTFFFFFTCVPHPEPSSLLPPHTIPLGRPRAPAPSGQVQFAFYRTLAATAVRMSASKESRDFTNSAVAAVYTGIGDLLPDNVCTIQSKGTMQ